MENFSAQGLAGINNTESCNLDLHEIISFSPAFNNEDVMSNHLLQINNDINQDMLLNTFLNGCHIKSDQLIMNLIPSSEEPISNTSFVLPTLKISNLNQPTNFFDVNLPALHPFGYPTVNGSVNNQSSQLVHNNGDLLKENYGIDQMKSKRPAASNSVIVAKAAKANPTKKSKLELRPSCTPMKVRKEKLGDRILALQQMVAPFGKTDTASVLMEAIGYIKFLQNQVENLSMPYMTLTNCNTKISTRGGWTKDGNEESKRRDLKSRGLCLVPLSCLTYVTYGGEQCLLGNNN